MRRRVEEGAQARAIAAPETGRRGVQKQGAGPTLRRAENPHDPSAEPPRTREGHLIAHKSDLLGV